MEVLKQTLFLVSLTISAVLLPYNVAAYEAMIIDRPGSLNELKLPIVVGPESIAFDPTEHGPYTGVSDGRILKWQGKREGWTDFAYNSLHRECMENTDEMMEGKCGRPLGLRFHNATGNLYIADAYHGLLTVGPEGGPVEVLASEANGVPFNFLNGLDVDQETGDVYFTDSSTQFTRREYFMIVLTNDTTGRLMKYNPGSKRLTVLKDRLKFPNGVTMSHDNSHLLISLSSLCQVQKFWLRGPKAGEFELFADLPGYPDNITRDPRGGYWVALNQVKIDDHPDADGNTPVHPVAFRLDEHGNVLQVLDGGVTTSVSEVHERRGSLWIGSVINPYVGVHRI